jgi:hypothetical protein
MLVSIETLRRTFAAEQRMMISMALLRTVGRFLAWVGGVLSRVAGMNTGGGDTPAGPADLHGADYLFKPRPPEYRP